MARPKKIIEKEESTELTQDQVNYVLEFSNALAGGNLYNGILNPFLVNQRMMEISMNPYKATEDALQKALQDPKNSEIELQSFSQDFENRNQTYKRLLAYLGDLLSFDMTYTCTNAKPSDYTSKEYQKDLDEVKKFCDSFDYKQEFLIATRQMLRNEAFFCNVRFGAKTILQELPSSPQFTIISGRFPYGMLYDFNLYWFYGRPGVDINMYDEFYAKKMNEIFQGDTKYVPSIPIGLRGDSSWVYWQALSPSKPPYAFMFKLNKEIAVRLPFFTGIMMDLQLQDFMRALQKNTSLASATKLVLGEIPIKSNAQASVKNQYALDAKDLGNFLAVVKSAIGDAVRTAALPLQQVKGIEFTPNNNLYADYGRNTLAQSGVNTNLLYSSENKINSVDSQLSAGIDAMMLEQRLYPQFADFMNFYINMRTKKFKFLIKFQGNNHYISREQRLNRVLQLADRGIVLNQQLGAALGLDPFAFQREMEEAKATGFVDKLTPILQAAQMSSKDSKGGRPQKSDSELSDSGEQTRSDGGNLEKGGKI